jgi:hypothetical protein
VAERCANSFISLVMDLEYYGEKMLLVQGHHPRQVVPYWRSGPATTCSAGWEPDPPPSIPGRPSGARHWRGVLGWAYHGAQAVEGLRKLIHLVVRAPRFLQLQPPSPTSPTPRRSSALLA